MTPIQALILAIIQGVTELFPVSSLGHAVLVPALLHWRLNESDPLFLPFLTMLHFGTFIALLLVFAKDWIAIFGGATGRYGRFRQEQSVRILFLLIVATVLWSWLARRWSILFAPYSDRRLSWRFS